jgi:hypothetical protein
MMMMMMMMMMVMYSDYCCKYLIHILPFIDILDAANICEK